MICHGGLNPLEEHTHGTCSRCGQKGCTSGLLDLIHCSKHANNMHMALIHCPKTCTEDVHNMFFIDKLALLFRVESEDFGINLHCFPGLKVMILAFSSQWNNPLAPLAMDTQLKSKYIYMYAQAAKFSPH